MKKLHYTKSLSNEKSGTKLNKRVQLKPDNKLFYFIDFIIIIFLLLAIIFL